ncbi:CHASE3 domain-containing protein [Nocardia sp. CDC159]|uniref:histidine kinase n=1 Tax=Nocardia pulmonis TaxID=2951408 RepID=A0A9X2E4T6_9NOCA|nr:MULTISPECIES: sensor histidine kinase [Nocardia]MCM6774167.1 CHASE3 domain-containing protein [Nocardia pulmonis]MCM6787054.1 CHASE3 domain-containing protein [Nocardia sp. CDC159]
MVLVVIIGAVAGAQVIANTTTISDRLLDRTLPASAEAYRLQSALVDQETGVRGYAITADPDFLRPYTDGRQLEQQAAVRLRELLSDRPELLADLDAVEQAAERWRRGYAEPLTSIQAPAQARIAGTATADRGKNIFDEVRAQFGPQNDGLSAALAADNDALNHARTVRNAVLIGLLVIFLLAGVTFTVLVRRLVARPLRSLADSSLRVAGGEFDHRITPHGPADLAAVAEAVEDMRQRIVSRLDSSRAQEAVLQEQRDVLDAQAVELRRSNAELEQFAYVASHDLQEPLRKVASFCQLLEKRYGDQLDERGKQYIDFAVDGAKRMQVLINDLLTFSRVGRITGDSKPVTLTDPLEKALNNLSVAIEDTGARVERPDELPEIIGEPVLLTMLWQNLIGNAIKFRRPDQPPEIRLTCDPDPEGGWLFTLSDNGIGIAPEFAEKVFVIFQRLHTRDEYSGTGIGLAVCKKIVEFHGGRIWIDTDYTEGTRFCFTLLGTEIASRSAELASATQGATS